MAGLLKPLLGLVAEFIMANGTRAATRLYGPDAVKKGLKEIKRRQSFINKRVSEKRMEGEIPPREQTAAQIEARLASQRARRMKSEEPRPRFDEDGFPIDEVPLQFAEGGLINQQVGGFEDVRTMPAPPQPMQPRPSLVVGGPAFFTPEGYQAPVQPEQAFMPTDRRPDPIGDNFRRPYERPIMPMPSPPQAPQPAPPRVPIEQPKETLPVDPGPVRPMPMPEPTPQPKYDPFAYSDLGRRALGGEYIDSMTFHYFDPTTGKSGSTTKGYSRVPDSAKPYIYLNKEEADKARDKFLEYEDTGGATTPTPRRTPVTTPAPAPVFAGGPGGAKTMPINIPGSLGEAKLAVEPDSYFPMPALMKPVTLPSGQTVEIPDIDMEAVNASLAEYGITPKIPSVPAPIVPPTVPQPMPSAPSLPSVSLPTLPKFGTRPSLTRPIMRVNPRER